MWAVTLRVYLMAFMRSESYDRGFQWCFLGPLSVSHLFINILILTYKQSGSDASWSLKQTRPNRHFIELPGKRRREPPSARATYSNITPGIQLQTWLPNLRKSGYLETSFIPPKFHVPVDRSVDVTRLFGGTKTANQQHVTWTTDLFVFFFFFNIVFKFIYYLSTKSLIYL